MKNKFAKGALVMGVSAMSMGGITDDALAAENSQKAPMEHVITDTNVRKVVGVYIAQRATGIYIDRKTRIKYVGKQQDLNDEQYLTFLLDTNDDGIEDYICVRKSQFAIDYVSGTRMEITEKLDSGEWIIEDIKQLPRWTSRPVVYEENKER